MCHTEHWSFPSRVRWCIGTARLLGWQVECATTADGGAVDGTRPGETGPQWRVTWSGATVDHREARPRRSAAEMRRRTAGAPPSPVPFVKVTRDRFEQLLTALRIDGGAGTCRCCGVAAPPEAQLTLSAVGLCWSCRSCHGLLARNGDPLDTIPHPACAARRHVPEACNDTEPALGEPWRRDPRAVVCRTADDTGADLQAWLRRNGVHDAVVMVGRDWEIGLADLPDFRPVLVNHARRGWLRVSHGRELPVHEPARHELLAWLRVAAAAPPP